MVNSELYHHGIKGQKWGIRRFQNKDGTLTAAGQKRKYIKRNELVKAANYNAEWLKNAKGGGEQVSKKLRTFAEKMGNQPLSDLSMSDIKRGEKVMKKIASGYGFNYISIKKLKRGIKGSSMSVGWDDFN